MSTKEIPQVHHKIPQQTSQHEEIKKSTKRGGPYSKKEKDNRRNEVYRLHFEYEYSARKIADMMNVNRNTINADVDYWYYKIFKNAENISPEKMAIPIIERMKIQLSRLREQLDRVNTNSERFTIERLIYEINSRLLNTYQKLANSEFRNYKRDIEALNDFKKDQHYSDRVMSMFDIVYVSEKSQEKVFKILDEDKKHLN